MRRNTRTTLTAVLCQLLVGTLAGVAAAQSAPDDAVSRSVSIFNNTQDTVPVAGAASRTVSVFNNLYESVDLTNAQSRSLAAFNNVFDVVPASDAVGRAYSAFNLGVPPSYVNGCVSDSLRLEWNPIPGAVTYRVDVATAAADSAIFGTIYPGNVLSAAYGTDFQEGVDYYARVAGSPDGVAYFATPFSVGAVGDLTNPTANSPVGRLVDDLDVRFDFSGSDNEYIVGYEVEVAFTVDFDSLVADTTVDAAAGLVLEGEPGQTYYARARAVDCAGNVGPTGPRSNGVVVQLLADLAVTQSSVPDTAYSGQPFSVSWQVENVGGGATNVPGWVDRVYLSDDDSLDAASDVFLGEFENPSYLLPGEAYSSLEEVEVAPEISGPFYLLFQTDAGEELPESTSVNNVRVDSLQITLSPSPDLQVTSVFGPDIAFTEDKVEVVWTVTNTGEQVTADTTWRDVIFYSQDATLDYEFRGTDNILVRDSYLGIVEHNGALQPDSSYTASDSVWIPSEDAYPYGTVSYAPSPGAGTGLDSVRRVPIAGPEGTASLSGYLFVYTDCAIGAITLQNNEQGDVYEYVNELNNWSSDSLSVVISPAADLVIDGVTVPATANSGESVTVAWAVRNQGLGATIANLWTDRIYISPDSVFDASTATSLGLLGHLGVLDADTTYAASRAVTLPRDLDGDYYIYVVTDWADRVFENGNDSNNTTRISTPIAITLVPWADLAATDITYPGSLEAGQQILLSWTAENSGATSTGNDDWTDRVYVSQFSSFSPLTSQLLGEVTHTGSLAAGESYTRTVQVTLPATVSGSRYFHVDVDAKSDVFENGDEGNNVRSEGVTIAPYPPVDLVVSGVGAPDTVQAGETADISWTVKNEGAAATLSAGWDEAVYLSADLNLDVPGDAELEQVVHSGDLTAGAQYARNLTVSIPDSVAGTLYTIVRVDSAGTAGDDDLTNNKAVALFPIEVLPAPQADLVVDTVEVASTLRAGAEAQVAWSVRNGGDDTPPGKKWYDAVYLSEDAYPDRLDVMLGTIAHETSLMGDSSYADTLLFEVPPYAAGDSHIVVETDTQGEVFEGGSESNNVLAHPSTVELPPPADLVVTSVTAPAAAVPGDSLTVSWTVANQGPDDAEGVVRDGVYVSVDGTLSPEDPLVAVLKQQVSIPSGAAKSLTRKVDLSTTYALDANGDITDVLPGVAPGDYYVIVKTDLTNTIRETDDANNAGVSGSPVAVTISELALDVPLEEMLAEGDMHYLHLLIPEEGDLQVTASTNVEGNSLEIYLAEGRVPTEADFDYRANAPFTANQNLIAPNVLPGDYYLLYRMPIAAQTNQFYPVDLKATVLPFGLQSISPNHGGSGGFITCDLTGAGFVDGMQVQLVSANADTLPAAEVTLGSSVSCRCQFDLQQVANGSYTLRLERPDSSSILMHSAFSVEDPSPPHIEVRSTVPDRLRAGVASYVSYSFVNTSNDDVRYAQIEIQVPPTTEVSIEEASGLLTNSELYSGLGYEPSDIILVDILGQLSHLITFHALDLQPEREVLVRLKIVERESSVLPIEVAALPLTRATLVDMVTENASEVRETMLAEALEQVAESDIPPELFDDELFIASAVEQMEVLGIVDSSDVVRSMSSLPEAAESLDASDSDLVRGVGRRVDPSSEGERSLLWCFGSMPPAPKCKNVAEWCKKCISKNCSAFTFLICKPLGVGCLGLGPEAGSWCKWVCEPVVKIACLSELWGNCFGVWFSCDPNDITGPAGFGDDMWSPGDQRLPYTIHFQNDPQVAQVPAREVRIEQTLDDDLDLRSFELAEFGFANMTFSPPKGKLQYSTRLDARDSLGVYVDAIAGVDVSERKVIWYFRTIDPITGQAPTDPDVGFLPVDDDSNRGQGFVGYTIRPKAGLPSGTVIDAEASIVFDVNAPIATPAIFNTLDAGLPSSQVTPLVPVSTQADFLVSWSAEDDSAASGIEGVRLYSSEDNGPFELVDVGTESASGDTSVVFHGRHGHSYGFFTIARDNAGNEEPLKSAAEAVVTVGSDVEVWPGDTNNDGTVDQDDVLPVGLHFGVTGPARIGGSATWTAQTGQAWNAGPAIFADANGDGRVSQNDVLPIGLNFDRTHAVASPKPREETADGPTVVVPPLAAGTQFPVDLRLAPDRGTVFDLTGVSARLQVPGNVFSVDSVTVSAVLDDGDLLDLVRRNKDKNDLAVAYARKGRMEGVRVDPGTTLLTVWLTVGETMERSAAIRLTGSGGSVTRGLLDKLPLTLESTVASAVPVRFLLLQNSPNPVQARSNIRFAMPEPGSVSLKIFDVAGRLVKTIIDGTTYPAGWHQVTLDASSFASGVYFYRIQMGDYMKARKILVLR